MATVTPRTRLDREDLDEILESLQAEFPALRNHEFSLRRGIPNPQGGHHLEFYPAWEPGAPGRGRPEPGRHVIEILNPELTGRPLREMVAGDMLHLLGAVNPSTGQPVDPRWRALKQVFRDSLTPEQMQLESSIYTELARRGREQRPFDDYLDQVRLDGYIRAGIFPLVNPDWHRPGSRAFTGEQRALIEEMRRHLMTEPLPPIHEEFQASPPNPIGPGSEIDPDEGPGRMLASIAAGQVAQGLPSIKKRTMRVTATKPTAEDQSLADVVRGRGPSGETEEAISDWEDVPGIPTTIALTPAALAQLRAEA